MDLLLAIGQYLVIGDGPGPVAKILRRIVTVELLPEADPDLLGDVVGVGPVGNQRQDEAQQPSLVLPEQREVLLVRSSLVCDSDGVMPGTIP